MSGAAPSETPSSSTSPLRGINPFKARSKAPYGITQATRATADSLPAVLQNPLVGHLKEEAAKLEARYRELGQSFKPEYPRMQRLAESIAEVRRQLRAEIQRFVEAARGEYQAALQNETEIRKLVDAQRGSAAGA